MNEALETFLAALRAMPPAEREWTITHLLLRVCWFCGSEDPGCECWMAEEAEVPS